MSEHAVIVSFEYGAKSLDPLFELEEQLEEAIEAAAAGEFDGNEIAADMSDGVLYMYGPDANVLFRVIKPIVAAADCLRTATATLRFGPPSDGVEERTESIRGPTADR